MQEGYAKPGLNNSADHMTVKKSQKRQQTITRFCK